jgi:hypothetical protein
LSIHEPIYPDERCQSKRHPRKGPAGACTRALTT